MENLSHEKSHILVIDDEESLRLTFEMFLKRAGYGPIVGVSNFADAQAAIEQNEFDLIISDIVLQGSSGIDLLRHVKNLGRQCPMVMITGYPNIETAAEAVRLGAFDYIPKPVKKDALLKVVALALEHVDLVRERQHYEAESEKARYYQETILRSVREIIITIDQNLRIADMNDMAREWAKSFLPELTVGASLSSLSSSVGRTFLQQAETIIKKREGTKIIRLEWPRFDGVTGVLSITGAPLQDGNGTFLGVVITARELTNLENLEQRETKAQFHRLVGKSLPMQRIYALIESVGKVDATVLITGESGTGKELVVEALHAESPRKNRPLVKVDCTSIPEELLESELFGHKKGAFTGAEKDRLGRILQADGGTLFLDEIGDISSRNQLRLLRFLQERTFYPVGRDEPIHVDVRVITATNADLKNKVRQETFREDLYFRLRVVDIILPPLRERKEDIPLLVDHFLDRFEKRMQQNITEFSDQAIELLYNHSWPGNVRELEHIVERAYVLCPGGTITSEHLPQEILHSVPEPSHQPIQTASPSAYSMPERQLAENPEDETKRLIDALRRTAGNKAKAARLLGIDRSTLYRKMSAYNIDPSAIDYFD